MNRKVTSDSSHLCVNSTYTVAIPFSRCCELKTHKAGHHQCNMHTNVQQNLHVTQVVTCWDFCYFNVNKKPVNHHLLVTSLTSYISC